MNDYKQTVSDLIAEHYRYQQEVAHKDGLLTMCEASGPHQNQSDALLCQKYSDVPMGEFWARSKTHRISLKQRFLTKEAVSAGHIYGKNVISAESFTSVGPQWEEDPYFLKPTADRAFCEGINKLYFLPQDIEEIKRLYNYFNIDTIMLPPANMTLKEIKTIGSAGIVGINAIISSKLEEYKKFAESFAAKLKIPAIESRLPLTINETLVYLRELGEKLNMQETADYAILSEIRRLEKKINELRVYLSGKNCILAISHSIKFWNPMEFLHLLQDVGIKIKYIILLEELTVRNVKNIKFFLRNIDWM